MTQTKSDLLDENIRLTNVAGAQGEALAAIRALAFAARNNIALGHTNLADARLQEIQERVLLVLPPAAGGLRANLESEASEG